MEIRYMNDEDDIIAISRIYEKGWKYAYADIIPQAYLDTISEGTWNSNLRTPGRYTLVCVKDGEYVGTGSFGRSRFEEYPDQGEIYSIYFLPAYMHKGYGRKLFGIAMDELHKQGYDDLFLWVLADNHEARRFYEEAGFVYNGDLRYEDFGCKTLAEVCYIYHYE